MLATALIVFRETLEAALIVSIILAATRGVARRGYWVSAGILGGLLGACGVAAVAGYLTTLFDGVGQEILNATILFIAALLISWHVVWMSQHGREISAHMKEVGDSVHEGDKDLSVLAIVVGLAVMREGSEVVLMLQGLWATGAAAQMLSGGLLGGAAGVLAGGLLYLGFIALPIGRIFALTNGLLILIAAGMAARGGNFLAQADILPTFGHRLWDSSALVSENSITGKVLAVLIGYIAQPNGIEVMFYLLTITLVTTLLYVNEAHRAVRVAAVLLALSTPLGCINSAQALEVLSPYVTKGEFEFEHQGYVSRDRNPEASNGQTYTGSIGYSPTDWYRGEVEAEFARESGSDQNLRYESANIENTFQLTEEGEYWIDPALFYEMDFARGSGNPNTIYFGFLGAKTIGSISETFNLLLHKDYGSNISPLGFIYSNQAKVRYLEWLQPGFEVYGDTQGKSRFQDQQFATGPGLFGEIHTFDGQSFNYQLAYLFGATPATPDGAVRWKLEYEVSF